MCRGKLEQVLIKVFCKIWCITASRFSRRLVNEVNRAEGEFKGYCNKHIIVINHQFKYIAGADCRSSANVKGSRSKTV